MKISKYKNFVSIFLLLLITIGMQYTIASSDNGVKVESDYLPIGAIAMWGNETIPNGWIEMAGQSTGNYSELLSIFGSTLPDLRGRFVRGFGGNSASIGVVQTESIKSHGHTATFTGNTLPSHNHTFLAQSGSKDGGAGGSGADNHTTTKNTSSTSGGTPTGNISVSSYGSTETRPNNIAMKYIIKVK